MTSKEIMENILEQSERLNCDMVTLNISLDHLNILNQDIDRLEKLEKVIEIIKAKRVAISFLLTTLCVKEYNVFVITTKELSQEEYELLKEVLGDELHKTSTV